MKKRWLWILVIVIIFLIIVNINSKNEVKKELTNVSKISPTETEIIKNNEEKYLITKVIDGDTVIVKINDKEESVRLIGINTPESNECMGTEATNKLKELIENKEVVLESDDSQDDKDIYGRILRYIIFDGININQKMVEEGWAKEYTYEKAYKYQTEFKEAEIEAKKSLLGIWGKNICPTSTPTESVKVTTVKIDNIEISKNTNYVCDCSKSCTQMESCEEAYFQLESCGCSKRDGDGDGVPCESLCR